jgi:hypothetical protein
LGGNTNDYGTELFATQTVSGNTATITITNGTKYIVTNIEAD